MTTPPIYMAPETDRSEMKESTNKIVKDLLPLAVPIRNLVPLENNARKGDVEAVAKSYSTFGQRKPIVARKPINDGLPGVVIAGNHQLAAAKSLGWKEIAVVWVEDDDETAAAYSIADNRIGLLGEWDIESLLQNIDSIQDDELMIATGFSIDDLDDFEALLEETTGKSFVPAASNSNLVSDNLEEDNVAMSPSYADRLARYTDKATRMFVLEYKLDEFQWVNERLSELRKKHSLENNAAVLFFLLQETTQEDSRDE